MRSQQLASHDAVAEIAYPCYKSMDEFIDVAHLKSLDAFIIEKIEQHISRKSEEYFLNAYRLDQDTPHRPGAREIWLSRPKRAAAADVAVDPYAQLHDVELWEPTPNATEFEPLMAFIRTLPFESTSRILIIYDDAGTAVPAHKDHPDTTLCHEFIWFRTNMRKPFYMLNQHNLEKRYVESYSAWFDAVNQFHGTDPAEGLSFSIRVDGYFSDEFRKQIPFCRENLAATPALWAATTRCI